MSASSISFRAVFLRRKVTGLMYRFVAGLAWYMRVI